MSAAVNLGVEAAHCEYTQFKSQDALVVTRFDREIGGDEPRRLHQEDLCQALGVREKYEQYGGPSAA
jgi:serine/threonine-protein kinase HipA